MPTPILIDYREDVRKGLELTPLVARVAKPLKIEVEKCNLPFGDASLEGKGPDGPLFIGIERKKLSDMINCIRDARYSSHQLVGMKQLYGLQVLMVEGYWKPDITGYLLSMFGPLNWGPLRSPRMTRYSELFRYLLSVQLSGVVVIPTYDIEHTAYNIVEIHQYFQKKWDDHNSLMNVRKLSIPTLGDRPSLVRRWAADLDGVGTVVDQKVDGVFKRPIDLARADEATWLRVPGMGVKLARSIVRQVWGE